MKPRDRKLALKAVRVHRNQAGDTAAVARRLRLDVEATRVILYRGMLIQQCEGHRLTDNETLVMKTVARIEARRVERGETFAKANQVDFAAGKRSGWCYSVAKKRLYGTFNFVVYSPRGHVWLTPAGWAFVWATGLILKNWKVPA